VKTRNYIITPPPQDKCQEPLFRVAYSIDINASDKTIAAQEAWNIMQDKDSIHPILVVVDSMGKQAKT